MEKYHLHEFENSEWKSIIYMVWWHGNEFENFDKQLLSSTWYDGNELFNLIVNIM